MIPVSVTHDNVNRLEIGFKVYSQDVQKVGVYKAPYESQQRKVLVLINKDMIICARLIVVVFPGTSSERA